MSIEKYLDIQLSPEERTDDLLARMTVEEKVAQLQCYNPKDRHAPNLETYFSKGVGSVAFLSAAWEDSKEVVAEKIKDYQQEIMARTDFQIPAFFHIEGLTGVLMPEATSFPTGIGRGAAWNPNLEFEMGKVVGQEMEAIGIKHALAPVLDVSRDSRFGRQGESYGEDPTLVSRLGVEYVKGIQRMKADGTYAVMATSKHYIGYHAGMGGIHAALAQVAERELFETFGTPFQAAIKKANLRAVMNQYGTVNGEPVATSKYLLNDILRKEMGFNGLLVADYASIEEIRTRLKLYESESELAQKVLEATFDIELPTPVVFGENVIRLVKEGRITESLLDRAVRNVLLEKFRSGLFENPYPSDPKEVNRVFSKKQSKELSLDYARESLVMLKNDGILPLKDKKGLSIGLIGHHGKSVRSLFGGYSYMSVLELAMGARNTMAGIEVQKDELWRNKLKDTYPGSEIEVEIPVLEEIAKKVDRNLKNIYEAFKEQLTDATIEYSYGYPYIGEDTSYYEEALATVDRSDIVVVTVGGKYGWGTSCTTGEGIDATNINLPPCQEKFLELLGKKKIPFIVVHLDGRPLSSYAADKYASAIIEAWNPGQYGARAIVETLLGKNNPSGKLPVTIAYGASQEPLYYNHSNGSSYDVGTASAFGSYIDMERSPRYYFGEGKSFTTFIYENLKLEKAKIAATDSLLFSFELENTGSYSGKETVQVYIKDNFASMVRPVKALAGFSKIELAPGERKLVEVKIDPKQLAFLDEEMKWKIEKGEFRLEIGTSSKEILLTSTFEITDSQIIKSHEREFYASFEIM